MSVFGKIAAGIVIAASLAISAPANAATVKVSAKWHSSSLGNGASTGLLLEEGDLFSVTAAVDDMWRLGQGARRGNANGLTNFNAFAPAGAGLSALYGTLVGKIGSGDFFVIGTEFLGKSNAAGELRLFNWDSNHSDNRGKIFAEVTEMGAVPVPASAAVLIGGLGMLFAMRRRKKT